MNSGVAETERPELSACRVPLVARQWLGDGQGDGQSGGWRQMDEQVSREVAVTVLFGEQQLRLWACPHDLETLALGHVLLDHAHGGGPDSPALMAAAGQVLSEGGALRVVLDEGRYREPCTLPAVGAELLLRGMEQCMAAPGLWRSTGCFHRAGVLDLHTGVIVHMVEDIGRNNCVDRLAGWAARKGDGFDCGGYALLITARITAGIYAKIRRAGFTCIVSRAAVTSASVTRAAEQGVTLVGFCRPAEQRLTVFSDPQGRVV